MNSPAGCVAGIPPGISLLLECIHGVPVPGREHPTTMEENMSNESQAKPDSGPTRQGSYVAGYSPPTVQHLANRTVAYQAAFFLPHLRPGMRLLDCGCGPGPITLGLAQTVAPGQVVGIDIEPCMVERASVLGREQGISNVHFRVANVFELPFSDGTFDAAFAHTLLYHLDQPLRALQEMGRVLKSGGVIGIRDEDDGGRIIAPANKGLEDYYALRDRVWKDYGVDMRIGRRLRSLLRQAGFVRIEASASYDYYGTPADTRVLAQSWIARIESTVAFNEAVAAGRVERATLDNMIAVWREWGEDPDAFYANSMCEVVGWKE
jgi:ubiquinone/menaquinone biosynthesis C-methylase UbiE